MPSLMNSVNKTARSARMHRDALLSQEALCGNQPVFLLLICRNPGISQEQLAKRMFINKSNVTRQLAVLEQNGFITRSAKVGDKRVLQIFPSEKALSLCPKVQEVLREWNEYLLADFAPEQRELFLTMMQQVAQKAMARVELEELESE